MLTAFHMAPVASNRISGEDSTAVRYATFVLRKCWFDLAPDPLSVSQSAKSMSCRDGLDFGGLNGCPRARSQPSPVASFLV
jgi:hypothetical protein